MQVPYAYPSFYPGMENALVLVNRPDMNMNHTYRRKTLEFVNQPYKIGCGLSQGHNDSQHLLSSRSLDLF